MGEISAWVGIGLTALAMTAGCVAYVHALMGGVHTRINAAREYTDEKVRELKLEASAEVGTEREERRREQDRLERAIDSFGAVGTAVAALVEGVKHLGDRLGDHQKSNDRALDEIKHGMRNMDTKIQALSRGDARATRD